MEPEKGCMPRLNTTFDLVTAMNHRYDKSGNAVVGVTSRACIDRQSVAGIQKYASQASIHGIDQDSLSTLELPVF